MIAEAWRALGRSEEGAYREYVTDERHPQRLSGPVRTGQDPCDEVLELARLLRQLERATGREPSGEAELERWSRELLRDPALLLELLDRRDPGRQ